MSDGSIDIDTKLDGDPVYQELKKLQREMKRATREMELEAAKSMLPFRKQMMETERKMFDLAKSMGSLDMTNKQFMDQVKQLGAEYKKASDAMINANKMIAQEMIQTAGYMMNMTTQASRISSYYEKLGNPLYNVNKAGLAAADAMNKLANAGHASVLALKQLGPNASMKELVDMQNMIIQGQMRFQMVALASAATSILVYGALHKAAMESNKGYADSFNTMVSNIKKAFEPMVEVFAMVMTKVYDFINTIAEMVIKFNEAHPVIAKIVQGIMMLIPALTLLLSPLAVGIGLVGGFMAAWNSLWMIIGPLITGLAAMSGTILLVSAAIVGLVAGITYLWKTNEGFRNAIITAWQNIVSFVSPVIQSIKENFINSFNMIKESAGTSLSALGGLFQALMPLISTVAKILIGNFVSALTFSMGVINAAAAAIGPLVSAFLDLVSVVANVVASIVSLLMGDFDGALKYWNKATESAVSFFKNLWKTVVTFVTTFVSTIVDLVSRMGDKVGVDVGEMASKAADKFKELVTKGVNYITDLASKVKDKVLGLKDDVVNKFNELKTDAANKFNELKTDAINKFNELKSQVTTAINNLKSDAVNRFNELKSQVTTAVSTLKSQAITHFNNLKSQALTAFNNLKSEAVSRFNELKSQVTNAANQVKTLVTNAFNALKTAVTTATNSTKSAVQSGWNSAKSIVSGIVNTIKSLVSSGFNTIKSTVSTATNAAKSAIQTGWNSAKSVVSGAVNTIKSTVSNAFNSLSSVVSTAMNGVKNAIQSGMNSAISYLRGIDLTSIGRNIIQGLLNGITSLAGAVAAKVKSIADSVASAARSALKIKSPSRVMIEVGEFVGQGLIVGMDNTVGSVKQASVKLAKAAVPDFSSNIEITKKELERLNSVIENVNKKDAKAIAKIHKDAAAERAQIAKDANKQIDEIEANAKKKKRELTASEERQINNILKKMNQERAQIAKDEKNQVAAIRSESQANELSALKSYVDRRKELGLMTVEQEVEFWKQARSEFAKGSVERIQAEQLYQKTLDQLNKGRFENEKNYIADKKYYNQMSLTEELAAYQQYVKGYKQGTDERIYYEKEVYRVKQEISKQIDQLNADYLSKVEALNKELAEGERKLTEEYQKALSDREKSLYSFAGLFEKVTSEELSGTELLDNLQSQVTAFENWERDITELAGRAIDEGLMAELKEMGPKAADEIAALSKLSDEDLTTYVELWRKKHELAKTQATEELAGLKIETEAKIDELRTSTAAKLVEYTTDWQAAMVGLKGVVKGEMSEMPTIGSDAVQGIIDGLLSKEGELIGIAQRIADSMKATLQSALDIHSPSRWMRDFIGKNMMLGLQLGIEGEKSGTLKKVDEMLSWIMPNASDISSRFSNMFTRGIGAATNNNTNNVNNSRTINVTTNAGLGANQIAGATEKALRRLTFQWG